MTNDVSKGQIIGGSIYSDYLPVGQVDGYYMYLTGGVTYELDVTYASAPLDIAIAGPSPADNAEWTNVASGQILTYTAPVTGAYGAALDTASGVSGNYTITGGDARVNLTDMTAEVTTTPFMTPYSGPVAGLTEQFIDLSPDNLNITATAASVFLHSGAGEDALQVRSGNNVLDGSTGSNFLVGGIGNDTFFIDDRAAASDIWSTLVNFHAGNSATAWGVSQAGFTFADADNMGAAGYTGLTIEASAPGHPNASITLPGYTVADLNNGRLSVTFGVDPASGSSYANIHAN